MHRWSTFLLVNKLSGHRKCCSLCSVVRCSPEGSQKRWHFASAQVECEGCGWGVWVCAQEIVEMWNYNATPLCGLWLHNGGGSIPRIVWKEENNGVLFSLRDADQPVREVERFKKSNLIMACLRMWGTTKAFALWRKCYFMKRKFYEFDVENKRWSHVNIFVIRSLL